MTSTARARAVVLVSGGLDSATALAMAQAAGYQCHALAVDYGQRHDAELRAARRVADAAGVPLRVVGIDLRAIGGSALTDDIAVPEGPTEGIPVTYVPARNTILLALAMAHAEVLGAGDIFIGVNAIDYSGYPDCRPEFIRAFEVMANRATRAAVEGREMRIHTPLIEFTKAEIIRRGMALGVDYALTVSCYQADGEGRACGRCDSCRIRRAGFEAAGIDDPTPYRRD
ncbi:MAG: 7-cyano-7-deazaguanine synthase QueC [Xanthomonadales bacterium]|nr:7-cyano-7-deazaguanine synthase QueC [Xanthomonadales bacterium]NIN59552.1 7-cyano-7-deazaguanine synthase QueC [Xanthomonadales bacterium]NIN74918.1 7-cyano-7-deazaguanine synthase QueC [Xanthomonadales bacterium]NIO14060.1 7-cyano-7-deazaguanine synthase QueC [Xanthomonadales bacterium]NIP11945.1 7-cyano-7-deazaguanine synthase QueC [Xanthomonadales bacterium]